MRMCVSPPAAYVLQLRVECTVLKSLTFLFRQWTCRSGRKKISSWNAKQKVIRTNNGLDVSDVLHGVRYSAKRAAIVRHEACSTKFFLGNPDLLAPDWLAAHRRRMNNVSGQFIHTPQVAYLCFSNISWTWPLLRSRYPRNRNADGTDYLFVVLCIISLNISSFRYEKHTLY